MRHFQEIIQNADDAGARQVRFMLDETHYGQEFLLPTEGGLEKYQVSGRARPGHIQFNSLRPNLWKNYHCKMKSFLSLRAPRC